ncbi:hypothetical protein [Pontibacillus marinus]|uniref:Uncharacterized protein n=1 Tax=Pontibacillus marinus BH030004 = DSM 16465 TaxID=1385511 RepID=A0A0A5GIK3_9BACI|nr:hypothetical protein [Pontibacillus marinus]KGX91854.1 hypothetical protein N783_00155 [Pontibacillus marinus BH030004 = DSM 16465]
MEIAVDFDNELLEEMNVETVMTSPINSEIGVAILSSESTDQNKIVKVYSLRLQHDVQKYKIDNELQAFSFSDHDFARQFIERLPEMSAIELMFAMGS